MRTLFMVLLLAAAARAAGPADVLLDADRAFARAAAERGAAGFLSFFAEDASILPAKGPAITGKANLRPVYEKTWAQPGFSLQWQPLKAELARSGDLGYTFGQYERKFRGPGGKPVVQTGKYMTIWKKQSDKTWKVVVDMGN